MTGLTDDGLARLASCSHHATRLTALSATLTGHLTSHRRYSHSPYYDSLEYVQNEQLER